MDYDVDGPRDLICNLSPCVNPPAHWMPTGGQSWTVTCIEPCLLLKLVVLVGRLVIKRSYSSLLVTAITLAVAVHVSSRLASLVCSDSSRLRRCSLLRAALTAWRWLAAHLEHSRAPRVQRTRCSADSAGASQRILPSHCEIYQLKSVT